MAKLSRRMRAIAQKIDAEKAYEIDEAVTLLNGLAGSKFKESFDIAVNLGVDPRKSDQVVRGATTLPTEQARQFAWLFCPRRER